MNTDRLRRDLVDLAEEVSLVDLRDRVLRSSRQLALRRAVATSATALVLLGGATGAVLTSRPPDPRTPPPGALGFDLPVQAWPMPESSPDAARIPAIGRVFYGPRNAADDWSTQVPLRSWRPGTPPDELLDLPRAALADNAVVSPDGGRVAWVDQDNTLWMAAIDGSDRRKLRTEVAGSCWVPAWSPDSQRLSVAASPTKLPGVGLETYRIGTLDVVTGELTGSRPLDGCYPMWSADGTVLGYTTSTDGRAVIADPDLAVQRAIPNLGPDAKYGSYGLTSIAPDGRMVALYLEETRRASAEVIAGPRPIVVIDTRTGALVDLPLDGRALRQAYFQADGSLVARVEAGDGFVLVLLDAEGKKISETPEPAALKGMQILAVTS